MKILYASSEVQPFAASGGLADVAGSLPKALANLNKDNEVAVVLPLYVNTIQEQYQTAMEQVAAFEVPVGWRNQYCGVKKLVLNNVTYYFIDNEYYFKRDFGLYGYLDDGERFAFFSRAILLMLSIIDFKPDVINSNDWQTALVPVYYNTIYANDWRYHNIKNVFTIHNIGYQGRYGMELIPEIIGIPPEYSHIVEYDNDVNYMKGAIVTSDKVTTVSPTYAKEILDPWFSHGLDRILRHYTHKTCGFLNGIDTDFYNPQTDSEIAESFSAQNKKGKAICKAKLLEEFGLPQGNEPVIGIISRFADHKGFDLVREVFHQIISLGYKAIILGSGEHYYEEFFQQMHYSYPDKVGFYRGYNTALSRRIYSGADMFLMPSKSEPCGLAQMIALRYGTIPIVRLTGGLKDSIPDAGGKNGLGFTFLNYDSYDMLNAIRRAREYYDNKLMWGKLTSRAMRADLSWNSSAVLYYGLYKDISGVN